MSIPRYLWAILLPLTALPAFAQSYQAEVRGLVTDSSHSVVNGAKITLLDEGKHVSRVAISDGAGQYIFNQVDPASYEVDIESPGFKKFSRSRVAVGTGQLVTVDAVLEVGDTSQTVKVSADEPLLDSTNGSTSTALNVQQLNDLPSESGNGRSAYTTIGVSQNVQPVILGSGFIDQSDISTVSVAGSPESTNQYLVDGVPITDTVNRPVLIPATEATQELKVQVTTYDAEVGRTGGGVYNTLLKSGTNDLHGSLYGITRQPDFTANDFFNNRNGVPLPSTPYYGYAGSIGGPVVVPHLYDGRGRTFFFFAEEGFRSRGALTPSYAVPTELERTGDFSQDSTIIYDPFNATTNPDGSITRHQIVGDDGTPNKIPSRYISNVGQNIVNIGYPHPTPSLAGVPSGGINYTTTAPGTLTRGDEFVGKLDEQLFKWWAANVSYLHYGCLIPFGDALGTVPASGSITYNRHVDATNLNNIFTVNPTTIISVRFGFNRFPNTIYPYSAGYDPASLGLPAYNYQFKFFPPVNVTNYTPLSASTATVDNWYSRSIFTQVAKETGRHSLKAGFDFRGIYLAFTDFSTAPGSFTFTGQFTQSSPTVQDGGNALADLLLGLPVSGSIESSQKFYQYIHYWGVYVQDEFRITPRLTLNYGLRYEYETGLKDSNNNLVTGFNETVASPLAKYQPGTVGGLEFAGTGGRDEVGQLSHLKFAPRLGFSYALGDKTTIRGGAGIYYSPLRYDATAALQTGFTTQTALISSNDNYQTPAPDFTLNNPFPSGPLPPSGSAAGLLTGIGNPIAAYDSKIKSPAIYQFSIGIQRQLPGKILLETDYVGSRGRHLLPSPQGGGSASPAGGGRTNLDQLNPSYFSQGSQALSQTVANPFYQAGGPGLIGQPTVAKQQLLLPFPQFASVNVITTDSASSYNSFAARAERRFSGGEAFLVTYTWSRNYDSSYETSSPSGASNVGPQNIYDLRSEWGRSFINVPQRLTFTGSYVLPFGRGSRFLNQGGWYDQIVCGWQLNAITFYESGFPLNVTQNNLNSSIGSAVQRPNVNSSVKVKTSGSVYSRVNGFINPAAFSTVPEYVFGNAPKAIAERGPAPGIGNWNATLLKTVSVKDRVNFTFIAQAQNLFNHPWFALPNTTLGSPTFGRITSTYNNARNLQIGGRVTF